MTEAVITPPGADRAGLARGTLLIVDHIRGRLWDCRVPLISVLIGVAVMTVVPPVQDLLLEVRAAASTVGLAIILVVFWAIPVHNAGARSVEHIHRQGPPLARTRRAIDIALPILLGLATLGIAFFATRRLALSIFGAESYAPVEAIVTSLSRLQVCIAGGALVFLGYVVWRREVIRDKRHTFLASLFRAMPTALGIFTFLLLATAIVDPASFTFRVGREDLLPVVLGGWVPLFSWLALLSHRTGWPITALVLIGVLATTIFTDRFHDVRTFQSLAWEQAQGDDPKGVPRQELIAPAIDGWMAANNCTDDATRCPPALLVAAEGGGSRAAFYTATIIGALIDATRDDARYLPIANTIFAMSGVSGGALGIALARTALLDANGSGNPPCRTVDPNWFGSDWPDARDPMTNWRACLQMLAAGDYLSTTVIGATFRDTIGQMLATFSGIPVADRAALLERAIEEHYNAIVFDERTPCGGPEDARGLCRPFGYLPRPVAGYWLPLLFLNATSVDTGRQVIATDLQIGADFNLPGHCKELYPFSYSVFEILASGGTEAASAARRDLDCAYPGLAAADDIRLSTAVVMSARFPIVSPRGNLRNRSQTVVEQVVDGAFFDNTGLDSLMPLIPQLRKRGLHPVVIHIANKPWELRRPGSFEVPGRPEGRDDPHHVLMNTMPRNSWGDFLEGLSSPLLALNNGRSGHVERAEEAMMNVLSGDPDSAYISPRLYPKIETAAADNPDICGDEPDVSFTLSNLSMSWWLSPILQKVIDSQLCDPRDGLLLADVLERLQTSTPAKMQ